MDSHKGFSFSGFWARSRILTPVDSILQPATGNLLTRHSGTKPSIGDTAVIASLGKKKKVMLLLLSLLSLLLLLGLLLLGCCCWEAATVRCGSPRELISFGQVCLHQPHREVLLSMSSTHDKRNSMS